MATTFVNKSSQDTTVSFYDKIFEDLTKKGKITIDTHCRTDTTGMVSFTLFSDKGMYR